MGKVAKTLPEYLTAAEVEIMLECAPHTDARLLMLIQWRAGLRVSEALALTWADVQLDDGLPTIRVRRGKGYRPRIVPLDISATYPTVVGSTATLEPTHTDMDT